MFFFFLGQFWCVCFVRNLPFFQLAINFLLATILTVSTKIFLWEMFIIIHSKISSYFPCDFFFDHELNNTFIFSSFLKNSLNRYRFLSWEDFFSFSTLKMSLHCLDAMLLNSVFTFTLIFSMEYGFSPSIFI